MRDWGITLFFLKSSIWVTKWLYLGSEAENEKTEGTFFYQLLILKTFCFLVQKDTMQIERDMAVLWFSLSESEKDATEHETKAGVEISQCKTTNQHRSKNKKCLK